MTASPPALVVLQVWTVPTRAIPRALARMALDRRPLRGGRTPGLRFAKLLGTGDGRTFTVRDADPRRWALLTTWEDADAYAAFGRSRTASGWADLADESWSVRLRPVASRGRWAGQEPFGVPELVGARAFEGPVAAITRARITAAKTATFWRAVPPVSADLHAGAGLRFALGIGEAPIGLQGTFSLWESADALRDFAYGRPAHQEAIRRTATEQWYAEELFARFAVLGSEGSVDGRDPAA